MVFNMQRADRITGIITLLLGAWVALLSTDMQLLSDGVPGPGLLPLICGVVFVVLGLALLLKPTEAGTPVPWPKAQDGGRVLGAVASMVIFTSLVPVLGFPVAAALFLAAMIWWWADYSPWLAVLLGVVLALTMMLVFQVLLNAPLPEGLWQ